MSNKDKVYLRKAKDGGHVVTVNIPLSISSTAFGDNPCLSVEHEKVDNVWMLDISVTDPNNPRARKFRSRGGMVHNYDIVSISDKKLCDDLCEGRNYVSSHSINGTRMQLVLPVRQVSQVEPITTDKSDHEKALLEQLSSLLTRKPGSVTLDQERLQSIRREYRAFESIVRAMKQTLVSSGILDE